MRLPDSPQPPIPLHPDAPLPFPARPALEVAGAPRPTRQLNVRLALVAGSEVPSPAAGQVTDARERFLAAARLAPFPLHPAGAPVPASLPSLTLLARIPRLLH